MGICWSQKIMMRKGGQTPGQKRKKDLALAFADSLAWRFEERLVSERRESAEEEGGVGRRMAMRCAFAAISLA